MIKLTQITKAEDLLALREYFSFSIEEGEGSLYSVGMIQMTNELPVNRAAVSVGGEGDSVAEEQVAESFSRLLLDSAVLAEPDSLKVLRDLLEKNGYEGEIHFVPVGKLVQALFPKLASCDAESVKNYFSLKLSEETSPLREAEIWCEAFRRCRDVLSGTAPVEETEPKPRRIPRISDQQLKEAADRIWSVNPWTFLIVLISLVIVMAMFFPRKEEKVIDLEEAPAGYIVLSWDETGKYGRQPRSRGEALEFRIPYGVYNVLNNNSIPVELTISPDPDYKSQKERTQEAVAEALAAEQRASPEESASPGATVTVLKADGSRTGAGEETGEEKQEEETPEETAEEEEEKGPYTVILRPSSNRQIIIDRGEFLSLSEDAKELILFYVSEVPEEIDSTETGRVSDSQAVVYAYVKGTEVRFRSAPSLEGHIIEVLNNGQQVQVLGVTGEWTHVSIQDHKGYIYSEFLTRQEQD